MQKLLLPLTLFAVTSTFVVRGMERDLGKSNTASTAAAAAALAAQPTMTEVDLEKGTGKGKEKAEPAAQLTASKTAGANLPALNLGTINLTHEDIAEAALHLAAALHGKAITPKNLQDAVTIYKQRDAQTQQNITSRVATHGPETIRAATSRSVATVAPTTPATPVPTTTTLSSVLTSLLNVVASTTPTTTTATNPASLSSTLSQIIVAEANNPQVQAALGQLQQSGSTEITNLLVDVFAKGQSDANKAKIRAVIVAGGSIAGAVGLPILSALLTHYLG